MNFDSKIMVTGGAGLVGSAIIRDLIKKGYRNITATYYNRIPADNIPGEAMVKYVRTDLSEQNQAEALFSSEKPEYVYHAAAKVGGIHANDIYRADFIYQNTRIQSNVIHMSYKYGVKKLLYLGSSCIYPKECPQPIKEEYLLTGKLEYTNEPFAISKIAGIIMCESYNIQYGTDFIAVMPTNLYGSNDSFDLEKSHVFPALIRKIHLGRCLAENSEELVRKDLDKNPIDGVDGSADFSEILNVLNKYGVFKTEDSAKVEIWGTGRPARDFMHSDDMADACNFVMKNVSFDQITKGMKEIRNTHINIGTGSDITIKDLAYLIADCLGFSGELYFNTDMPDGTMKKLQDTSRINKLGWKHSIDFVKGINEVYSAYISD